LRVPLTGAPLAAAEQDGKPGPEEDLWPDGGREGADRASGDPTLVVDVDGFEGPLDLLLSLARSQKVDILRISILDLAEQYLRFIEEVRNQRLEIAADYLVMAAWLAYLKSRMLLPDQSGEDEPTGEELAAALQFRLRRLEAMRDAVGRLVNRNRLGRDIFARGMPEPVVITRTSEYLATSYELLTAYGAIRQRQVVTTVRVGQRRTWSLTEAREALIRLIGIAVDWTPIDAYLARYFETDEERATVRASSFSASLELVREGKIELRQTGHFKPLFIRARKADDS